VLLGLLLKWEFQVSRRSWGGWATVRIQQREIATLLLENPSLKPYRDEALGLAYLNGRDLAIAETDLPEVTFPIDCPYWVGCSVGCGFLAGGRGDWGVGNLGSRRIVRMPKHSCRERIPMVFGRPEAIVSPTFLALQLTLNQILDTAYGEG
jgi:Domain of unknown function DUF29